MIQTQSLPKYINYLAILISNYLTSFVLIYRIDFSAIPHGTCHNETLHNILEHIPNSNRV